VTGQIVLVDRGDLQVRCDNMLEMLNIILDQILRAKTAVGGN